MRSPFSFMSSFGLRPSATQLMEANFDLQKRSLRSRRRTSNCPSHPCRREGNSILGITLRFIVRQRQFRMIEISVKRTHIPMVRLTLIQPCAWGISLNSLLIPADPSKHASRGLSFDFCCLGMYTRCFEGPLGLEFQRKQERRSCRLQEPICQWHIR